MLCLGGLSPVALSLLGGLSVQLLCLAGLSPPASSLLGGLSCQVLGLKSFSSPPKNELRALFGFSMPSPCLAGLSLRLGLKVFLLGEAFRLLRPAEGRLDFILMLRY